MQFKDKASIIIEQQIEDGYGGFSTVEELYGEIKVTTGYTTEYEDDTYTEEKKRFPELGTKDWYKLNMIEVRHD